MRLSGGVDASGTRAIHATLKPGPVTRTFEVSR